MRAGRFTLDGSDPLEAHLVLACRRILSGVRGLIGDQRLQALVLGGGYGRGEGGVLRESGGDRPYNDLEFYVAVRGNRHVNELRYRRGLEALGHILTHLADVEVEFKITSLSEIAGSPVSMFSYDLAAGHRLLWGGPGWERATAHHHREEAIPAAEASRLLMNRGSGLLFARLRLESDPFTAAAADFVQRNIAKAQLACGDAILAERGNYHWSCRERHRRLGELPAPERPPDFEAILRDHASGVKFKLHPQCAGPDGAPDRSKLAAAHAEITKRLLALWMNLESRRLGRNFADALAYAADPNDQCPDTSRTRNFLINVRQRFDAPSGAATLWRHPRQRVCRVLAVLLATTDPAGNEAARKLLQGQLATEAQSFADFVAAYEALWRRVR